MEKLREEQGSGGILELGAFLGPFTEEFSYSQICEKVVKDFEGQEQRKCAEQIEDAVQDTERYLENFWLRRVSELESHLRRLQSPHCDSNTQKEAWERENAVNIKEDCRLRAAQEQQEFLYNNRKLLTQQLHSGVTELTRKSQEQFNREILELKRESDSQFLENLKKECFRDLMQGKDFALKKALSDKLGEEFEGNLRKELAQKLEHEIRAQKQGELLKEIRQSHEQTLQKIENEYREKTLRAESQFELTHKETIENALAQKEKELNVIYLRKKEATLKHCETAKTTHFNAQVDSLKTALGLEKLEVARLRSSLNVKTKRLQEKRKQEANSLKQQQQVLQKKIKLLDSQPYIQEPFNMQFPTITLDSFSHAEEPLPPPRPHPSPQTQNSPRKLLGPYSSQDIASSLLYQNLETAKQQAWTLLRETEHPPRVLCNKENKEKEAKLRPNDKTQSRYNKLLQQRFGVIEPRHH